MTIRDVVQAGYAVQVMFYDEEEMRSGIMFGDKIICACCGGIFEVEDVYKNAQVDGVEVAIRMFTSWVDLSDEIKGDASEPFEGTVVVDKED